MKKLIPLLLCLALLLSGCADRHSAEVCIDDYTLTVDTKNHTVTHGEDVYFYEYNEKNVIENTVTIRYPNGATYQQESEYSIIIQGGSAASGSDDTGDTGDTGTYTGHVDTDRYIGGEALAKAVRRGEARAKEAEKERAKNIMYLICAAVLLLAAFVNVRYADDLWYLRHHWHVSGGEPTEFYYDSCRLGAVVSIMIAVVLVLIVIF